jgi:hypothetical protein
MRGAMKTLAVAVSWTAEEEWVEDHEWTEEDEAWADEDDWVPEDEEEYVWEDADRPR